MGKKHSSHRRRMKGDRDNFEKVFRQNQQRTHFRSRNGFIGSKSDWRNWRYQQAIKRQLINSKGAICGICGKPITNMKDCTIDHIIPISKGGMTTLDNCQLAHKLCNNRKGSKIYESRKKNATL